MRRSNTVAAVLAGAGVFLVGAIPTSVMEGVRETGSIGEADGLTLRVSAAVVLAALSAAAGWFVYRGLQVVGSQPGRRRADVWVSYYLAQVVWITGTMTTPLLLLFLHLEEGRSLEDHGVWVFVEWILAHLVTGALAGALGRWSFRSFGRHSAGAGPEGTEPPTAEASAR